MSKPKNRVDIRFGLNSPLTPCKDCADRTAICHFDGKCERWAKWEEAKAKIRAATKKDQELYTYGSVVDYKPNVRRKYNATVKGNIK